jgi:hypothetical protein
VTLIVTALVAGAAAGGKGVASEAVKDAYAGLKALVKQRLAGRPDGETALERHETKPEQWGPVLQGELVEADAPADSALIEAAKRVLELADPAGSQSGKYLVDVRGAHGVQIGDHGTQNNTFGTNPSSASG